MMMRKPERSAKSMQMLAMYGAFSIDDEVYGFSHQERKTPKAKRGINQKKRADTPAKKRRKSKRKAQKKARRGK